MTAKHTLIIGILFLCAFIVFTSIAKLDLLFQSDYDLTVKIQNHISPHFDRMFSFLSFFGRFDTVSIILLAVTVRMKKKLAGIIMLAFFAAAHFVELVGKLYLDHPGPPFMFYRFKEQLLFPELYVVGSSYPSGHSLRAMFLAVLFSYFLLKIFKKKPLIKFISLSVLWVTALCLMLGKVVLGQHWASDVVGGMLLGLSFGFLSQFIIHYNRK